jgi:hypothetical protein
MESRFTEANNRRLYPRRKATFAMSYVLPGGQEAPAFGLDLSGGGMGLLTREIVYRRAGRHLELTASIESRTMSFEADLCWEKPIVVRGETEYRLGVHFVAIDDRDWEYVMAYSVAELGEDGVAPGALLTAQQLDTMLPVATQQRIAERLVASGRLGDPGDGRLPLIEYTFHGYRREKGVPYYRLLVRTKVVLGNGEAAEYSSHVSAGIEAPDIVIE